MNNEKRNKHMRLEDRIEIQECLYERFYIGVRTLYGKNNLSLNFIIILSPNK